MGMGVFVGGQPRPSARGRAPSLPNLGVLFYFCVHPLTRRSTKSDEVTHLGRGLVLGVSDGPVPKGRSPSAPQFLGFSSIYSL